VSDFRLLRLQKNILTILLFKITQKFYKGGLKCFYNTFKYRVSCTDGNISVRIIYFNYLFFHRLPTNKLCFLSCRPFVVNATFSTGLVAFSVFCPSQETEETTRPVENVAWMTKGLQERKQLVSRKTVEK
jgi:hypothetical protein